jgi:TP901 family phage tail tape measure protein
VSRLTFPPGLDDVGRNVAIRLTADTSRYQREMLAAGHVTGELMEEVTGLDEVIHRTARRAGIAFMGLGALMAANTAIWTNQAAQWEMAFADVVKTVEDTPQALRRVNRELRQMSARDIPVVAGELAQLATIAGQLGIETDNISKFVEVAARLGVAVDDMGAEQAIFMLAQFNNIMGESETDIDRVASALVEMGNTVATTEGQVMNFATRMAGAAAVVGMSSAEVIGISAAFTSVGVEAERGSTAVQRVLLAMNDAVSRGGIELERFSRLVGLTTDEFRRMFRENPAEIFARFLEELTEAGEDANLVLAQLGLQDQRLISSFLAMSQATEDLRTVMNRSTRAFQENTELVRESDEFFNTLILNVRQLRNGVEEFWRSLGQGLLPPLKLFVQMLQLVMNVLNRIPQPIMSLIGILTALGASLLLTVGFLMTLSRAFEMAFAVHFVGRVTAVRAAIAGLAAGLLDLASAARIMEASRLGAFFVNLGAGIREAMVAMVGLLRRVPMLSGAVTETALAHNTELAVDRLVERSPSWYLDLRMIGRYTGPATGPRVYHHTAPVAMITSLHAGLGAILEEGLDAAIARHAECGRLLHEGLEGLGRSLFAARARAVSARSPSPAPPILTNCNRGARHARRHWTLRATQAPPRRAHRDRGTARRRRGRRPAYVPRPRGRPRAARRGSCHGAARASPHSRGRRRRSGRAARRPR